MRVIATEQGYDGRAMREPGEVFDMPDTTNLDQGTPGKPGTDWFRVYADDVPEEPDEPARRRGKASVGDIT